MNFSQFYFLTDENIDDEVVQYLRSKGLDVLDIKEEGLFGLSDVEILELAFSQNRVVVTQDSDFGTLIFRDYALFYGVVYLRPGHESPKFHIDTIHSIFECGLDFHPPFMLVAENLGEVVKLRVRHL